MRPARRPKRVFHVSRGKTLLGRTHVVRVKSPYGKPRVIEKGRTIIITLPGKGRKGGRKMRPRPKPKPKNPWVNRGVATALDVRGQRLPMNVQRPSIDITRQRGFNVRVKQVGPKKRKIVI